MANQIADYAMIGNCESAALVSKAGSIDWLCMPRFDSAAFFARLLGDRDNGHWSINPEEQAEASRAYRPGTLILETTFEGAGGTARVVDFMVPRAANPTLVRLVEGVAGEVSLETELVIRFDYGRSVPWVTHVDDHTLTALAGPSRVTLHSQVVLHGRDHRSVAAFTVAAGERLAFVLQHQPSIAPQASSLDAITALAETEAYWRAFSDRCPAVGPWSEIVKRSLITLKALTYEPTGGIVAAPTTSLPEWIGGPRNWDYRYCWLRDATFTLQAFMGLGYFEEAEAWRDWLMRAIAGDPAQIQIMYGIAGERDLWEQELPWLAGFRQSRPVRIGNGAAGQLQLDVYGEVADAIMQAAKSGLPTHPRTRAVRGVAMEHLAKVWREPDDGIWEVRSGRQHFVHSKVMSWVAFDRAATMLAVNEAYREQAEACRAIAHEIHAEVCAEGFDPELNSFVQHYGSKELDASLLQLAIVGFLPPDDPRIVGTVDAVAARLTHDGFVLRYNSEKSDDGLPPGEGAFLICSFWLVDNYCLLGRWDEARALFEKLIALRNDVDLLAEEYDPQGGEMLGNFPQAFSHVGLIIAALNLSKAGGPAQERADVAQPT